MPAKAPSGDGQLPRPSDQMDLAVDAVAAALGDDDGIHETKPGSIKAEVGATSADDAHYDDQYRLFKEIRKLLSLEARAEKDGRLEDAKRHRADWKALKKEMSDGVKFKDFPPAARALYAFFRKPPARDALQSLQALIVDVDLGRTYGKDDPFPLIWALRSRRQPLEFAKALLVAGAPVGLKIWNGETALHKLADGDAGADKLDAKLALLLGAGAELNARTLHYTKTPLLAALYNSPPEMAALMVAAGAELDNPLELLNAASETPDSFALLLSKGVARALTDGEVTKLLAHFDKVLAKGRKMKSPRAAMAVQALSDNVDRLRADLALSKPDGSTA